MACANGGTNDNQYNGTLDEPTWLLPSYESKPLYWMVSNTVHQENRVRYKTNPLKLLLQHNMVQHNFGLCKSNSNQNWPNGIWSAYKQQKNYRMNNNKLSLPNLCNTVTHPYQPYTYTMPRAPCQTSVTGLTDKKKFGTEHIKSKENLEWCDY
jgi:hypothetical protein